MIRSQQLLLLLACLCLVSNSAKAEGDTNVQAQPNAVGNSSIINQNMNINKKQTKRANHQPKRDSKQPKCTFLHCLYDPCSYPLNRMCYGNGALGTSAAVRPGVVFRVGRPRGARNNQHRPKPARKSPETLRRTHVFEDRLFACKVMGAYFNRRCKFNWLVWVS